MGYLDVIAIAVLMTAIGWAGLFGIAVIAAFCHYAEPELNRRRTDRDEEPNREAS